MDNFRRILVLCWLAFVQVSVTCCQSSSMKRSQDNANQDVMEVKVGTKTFKTAKVTKQGTPVVPMWNAQMPTDDISNAAGFPVL